MNTILQKRIEAESNKYMEEAIEMNGVVGDNLHYKDLKTCFIEGATFALQNQWISVEETLPEEKFNDGYEFVFVKIHLYDDTFYYDTDYIRKGKWELHKHQKITHWMPIPSLEGGEK